MPGLWIAQEDALAPSAGGIDGHGLVAYVRFDRDRTAPVQAAPPPSPSRVGRRSLSVASPVEAVDTPDRLLTTRETCAYLRVSTQTLYRLVRTGLAGAGAGQSQLYRFRLGDLGDDLQPAVIRRRDSSEDQPGRLRPLSSQAIARERIDAAIAAGALPATRSPRRSPASPTWSRPAMAPDTKSAATGPTPVAARDGGQSRARRPTSA